MSASQRIKIAMWIFTLGLCCGLAGCIEEFEAEDITDVLEGTLVIDARISDQNIRQTIFLSRTFSLQDSEPLPENGAQVSIINETGTRIDFSEMVPGAYSTNSAVALEQGRSYTLEIITVDGVRYISDEAALPNKVEITNLSAEKRINGFEKEGIAILVDNTDRFSGQNYYRYEYEETYKILAPDPNPFDWDEIDYDINDGDGWEVTVAARDKLVNICYGTNSSKDIILASTAGLNANSVDDFEVRFLHSDTYAISHRYSILVKQYHHDVNANSFFSLLKDFSSAESIFSNVQTGGLEGNITVQNSGKSLVFGYFELSSYSEKRLFFDYDDFFPNEPLPPYLTNCFTGAPPLYPEGFHITPAPDGDGFIIDGTNGSPLIDGILTGLYAYHADNEDYEDYIAREGGVGGAAPFLVKPLGCVDCREFGSTVVPEFWTEE
ncbi:DUF4249 domain-containing protein [Maribacter chungangensis]|uniref:DUF4249 domain-containing protein n=1 Tax=Maribacter chungangensis TaxID=1069117 RepID=A0ABW3AZK4_9FLAO